MQDTHETMMGWQERAWLLSFWATQNCLNIYHRTGQIQSKSKKMGGDASLASPASSKSKTKTEKLKQFTVTGYTVAVTVTVNYTNCICVALLQDICISPTDYTTRALFKITQDMGTSGL